MSFQLTTNIEEKRRNLKHDDKMDKVKKTLVLNKYGSDLFTLLVGVFFILQKSEVVWSKWQRREKLNEKVLRRGYGKTT